MPSRTQITRHDCVEGWAASASGRARRSAPCSTGPRPTGERASSSSAASIRWKGLEADGRDTRYYESIDLEEAHHAQTILAYDLNDKPLPVINGAPITSGSSASSTTSRPST